MPAIVNTEKPIPVFFIGNKALTRRRPSLGLCQSSAEHSLKRKCKLCSVLAHSDIKDTNWNHYKLSNTLKCYASQMNRCVTTLTGSFQLHPIGNKWLLFLGIPTQYYTCPCKYLVYLLLG